MDVFIDYIIMPEKELVVEYFSGKVFLKDVIEFKKRLIQDPEFNKEFDIIDDLRDAKFDLIVEEVKGYVDFVIEFQKNLGKRKTAFLTEEPNQVVISTLFNEYKKDALPIESVVVSTLSMAANYLNLKPYDVIELDKAISELKQRKIE